MPDHSLAQPHHTLHVGVVGQAGAIGRRVVDGFLQQGVVVHAVDAREGSTTSVSAVLDAVSVLIIAAPVSDVALHRAALTRGAHVVDVTLDRTADELRELDQLARTVNRVMIAMSGLAPGLTGLMALEARLCIGADADEVIVALLQSPTGSAGNRGTIEMLDLVTNRSSQLRRVPVQSPTGRIRRLRLFSLNNGESRLIVPDPKMLMVTGFSDVGGVRWTDSAVRGLRLLRVAAPSLYRWMRDRAASRKTRVAGERERTVVSVVVTDKNGGVLGSRRLCVSGDYDATAAIAVATSRAAVDGSFEAGAGHLSRFVSSKTLLGLPPFATCVVADSGWIGV